MQYAKEIPYDYRIKYRKNTNETLEYLDNYDEIIARKITQAIENIIKIKPFIYKKINSKYYTDFYQVRDETNQLQYTYSFDRYSGLGIRNYAYKSTNKLNTAQFIEFLNNKDAVKQFEKLINYKPIIAVLKNIFTNIYMYEKTDLYSKHFSSENFWIKINITPQEEQLINTKELLFNIRTTEFKLDNDGWAYGSDTNNLQLIISSLILKNHGDEINQDADKILGTLLNKYNELKLQEQKIDEELSKWLLIDKL
jgi:hypothetical protein